MFPPFRAPNELRGTEDQARAWPVALPRRVFGGRSTVLLAWEESSPDDSEIRDTVR